MVTRILNHMKPIHKQPVLAAILIVIMLMVSLIDDKSISDSYYIAKQLYFLIFVLPLVFFYLIGEFKSEQAFSWKMNLLDCFVVLYFLYSSVSVAKDFNLRSPPQEIISHFLVVVMYFIMKSLLLQFKEREKEKFLIVLFQGSVVFLICNSILGFLQLTGLVVSSHLLFKVTGAFGNPGPFAIFLVCLVSFAMAAVLYKNLFTKGFYKLSIGALLTTVFVVVFSFSRTAWISLLFVTMFFIWTRNGSLRTFINRVLGRQVFLRFIFGTLLLVVVTFSVIYVYKLKADSVSGRFFIWQLAGNSFVDKPIVGHGYNSFCKVFNYKQAEFFANPTNDADRFIQLADNSTFAFNEFLQVSVELGVVGLFLFAGLFVLAIFSKTDFLNSEAENATKVSILIAKAIVVVVLISSFFSYPMHVIPIQLVFFIALAIISSFRNSRVQLSIHLSSIALRVSVLLILALIIGAYYVSGTRFYAEKEWQKLKKINRNLPIAGMKARYEKLLPVMKYNDYFLYNYGSELIVAEQYGEGVAVLEGLLMKLNDSNIYTYIGYAYFQMGNYDKAEFSFFNALHIVPSKIFPRYYLVKVYERQGRATDAIEMAKDILKMGEKVPTAIGNSIMLEMKDFLMIERF